MNPHVLRFPSALDGDGELIGSHGKVDGAVSRCHCAGMVWNVVGQSLPRAVPGLLRAVREPFGLFCYCCYTSEGFDQFISLSALPRSALYRLQEPPRGPEHPGVVLVCAPTGNPLVISGFVLYFSVLFLLVSHLLEM